MPVGVEKPLATLDEGHGTAPSEPALGLHANWQQFWLLVVVNAFVGAMVGLERTVLPLIGAQEFGLASKTCLLYTSDAADEL